MNEQQNFKNVPSLPNKKKMTLRNFVLSFHGPIPASELFYGQHSTGNMAEADAMPAEAAPRTCFASMIGINTLVDARYYGEDVEDKDYYPGVVVGFSHDGFMVRFEEYDEDPIQDTKPEDVRVRTNDKMAQTSWSNMSTSRQNEKGQKVETAKAVGLAYLLPLGDKRKNKPYTCSVFCEENRFYACGGCPTCNDYYMSIGRRNPHVLLGKGKVMKQEFAPDAALVEMHYADVCRKNPTWCKDKNGNPIVPYPLPLMLQPAKRSTKKARVEAAYKAHDEAVFAEKTKTKAIEPPPYKCSPMCKFGQFAMKGGCPTCNEYYKLLGLENPMVTRDKDIVPQAYDEDTLRKHYQAVCKNNPEWAKDDTGKPIVPDTYAKSRD